MIERSGAMEPSTTAALVALRGPVLQLHVMFGEEPDLRVSEIRESARRDLVGGRGVTSLPVVWLALLS